LIHTPDGVATIYNWKNGKNYCGEMGEPVEKMTYWHIGGKNELVVIWIYKALGLEGKEVLQSEVVKSYIKE
jgi:hypothetical protein